MESIQAFFNPKSVAIVGATEKAGIGRVVCTNVISEPVCDTFFRTHFHWSYRLVSLLKRREEQS